MKNSYHVAIIDVAREAGVSYTISLVLNNKRTVSSWGEAGKVVLLPFSLMRKEVFYLSQ